MARATRSATQHHEKDRQPDPSTSARGKSSTKKRKRASLADNDDQPAQKQLRTESAIKEENPQDDDDKFNKRKLPELELAGDVPIDPLDAQKILDILEFVDAQGLLDRVFPLPSSDHSEPSTSKSQAGTFSLRTLLRESSQHPLRVLCAAVRNLFPISYHPRSRTSFPAAQQLRFCNLASSLLEQASFHSVPLPVDIDTLLSDFPEMSVECDPKPTTGSLPRNKLTHSHQTRQYALMQRLPSGTWWTSLTSNLASSDGKPLKDLPTANAELVAVLPSLSGTTPPGATAGPASPSTDVMSVTLGSYVTKKPPGYKPKLPGPRRISCGAFLDYGPFTSFAPVFEQDGVEVGRSTIGELFWRWEDRKKRWIEEQTAVLPQASGDCANSPLLNGVDEESLQGLFSSEQITLLKQALGLELEAAVQELLERNAKAFKRMEELQNQRLCKPGGFTPVEEGSEEWDIAQGILESLSILTTLRPRSSTSDTPPLIPSPSALHKLQRTLPTAPTRGWYGTLPAGRTAALRDDSTLYIKSTATAIPSATPTAQAATPTPTQPAPAPTAAAPAAAAAQAYPGYAYNYATPYRAGYQYKPGQATPYYPNTYAAQTTAQAQGTPQYYQGQQYNATAQQQYVYSSWYQYTPPAPVAAGTGTAGGTSRRGTPQPSTAAVAATANPAVAAATAPSTMPTSYAGFFSANAQTSGQRAVANTVLAAATGGKPYQPTAGGTWSTPASTATTGYVPPTLPPHMRSVVGAAGQAVATGNYNAAMFQPNYYGAYQGTASPAQ
ncbi:hypothetical protein PAXRUDRAFT_822265 [Paxillus rubicundulus Ve08.2h10]|uniref:Uncharacterized protein n=1 Tax=Paxillus rubicundulus Ve08.2h10 TaxID=930991 RepID=A0A0D0EA22_9AGAM|nr:hypothetical protein PAXRUDRAFT_822265 [Paxillus rubicundulus Ve08.2h10]